jgi:hypothetical protein
MEKQPNHETQLKQHQIKYDIPFVIQLGHRSYNCTYLKGKSQDEISALHLSQKIIDTDDPKVILSAMKHNNRTHAKCVAIMILNSYWKIKFWYPIFWRWLFHTYSSKDFTDAMQVVMEANGTEFFFQNTLFLATTNSLKMKMTKVEAEQLLAEQVSEKKPASSKSSQESQATSTTGK